MTVVFFCYTVLIKALFFLFSIHGRRSNEQLLEQCYLLYEYARFLEAVRKYLKNPSYNTAEAIEQAVAECISEGILADFLIGHRTNL